MPLYKGNSKIKELYKGSTKIKELYKGSTLIYSSGSKDSVQLYGWSYDSAAIYFTYKLGTTSNNGVIMDSSATTNVYKGMQSGTLGSANSIVKVVQHQMNITATYIKTIDMNGATVYFYQSAPGGYGLTHDCLILDNSEINARVLLGVGAVGVDYPWTISSITSNSLTVNSYTFTRNSATDFMWTTAAIR